MDCAICASGVSQRLAVSARLRRSGHVVRSLETWPATSGYRSRRSLPIFERGAVIRRRFSMRPMPIQRCPWDSGGGQTPHCPSDRTRLRRRLLLAALPLCHGCRGAYADSGLEAVDGSDPPLWDTSIGIGEGWGVHAHPTHPRGSLPGPAIPAGRLQGDRHWPLAAARYAVLCCAAADRRQGVLLPSVTVRTLRR